MSTAAIQERATEPRSGERRVGGGGLRLAAAFERVSSLPALAEARRRVLEVTSAPRVPTGTVVDLIESDTALTIAVLRAANNGGGPSGRCHSVGGAVDALTPVGVQLVAAAVTDYDVFGAPAGWSRRSERFRRHALVVRDATERIARLVDPGLGDHLGSAALLHDVGRLLLAELDEDYDASVEPDRTPEERVHAERAQFGFDHALAGAVLIRRWGLPPEVAAAIERHHAADASGAAAVIKLADLIAHHAAGSPIDRETMLEAALALDLSEPRLRALLYEFPGERERPRPAGPSPLSAREVEVLRGLAEGKVHKQIAHDLSLSVSTVRTHLHNVYRKIGAVDRAQAVLIARDNGWI